MLKIITVILFSLTSSMGKSVSHMVDTPEVYISSVRHDVNKPIIDTVISKSNNDDFDFGRTNNQVDDDNDTNDMDIDDDGDNDDNNQWW